MATVMIKAYPVDNWMSFIVWAVGGWTGRVSWERAHWTIAFQADDITVEYDLSAVGVRLDPMPGKVPNFLYQQQVSRSEVVDMLQRVREVREGLHHVCLESLLKAFFLPWVPRLDTCCGFVYYVSRGRLDGLSNYPERWFKQLYETRQEALPFGGAITR